jgi:PAS domain S-box-containing protein
MSSSIKAEKILESYRQSNEFINSLSEGLIVQNTKGYILECNTAAEKILSLSIDQMRNINTSATRLTTIYEDGSLFPSDNHPAMQVLKTGQSQENVIMGICRSPGDISWIRINSHPVVSKENGDLQSVVSIFMDITMQKNSEQELRKSESLMKSFINTINEGFHMVDKDFNIILANEFSKKLFKNSMGLEIDYGMNLIDTLSADRKKIAQENLIQVFKGATVDYEAFYNKIPGHEKWINITISPIKDMDGNILYAAVVFKDITAKKMADDLLKKNEERLRMAIDKTGDNAWEHNFQTGITWFSASTNFFLGYTSEEMNENENEDKWWSSTHPDDRALLIQNDKEYKAGTRQSHSIEYRIFHKDGTMKWVLDRGIIVERDAKGAPVRIIGTHTDISKVKFLQQQLIDQEQQKKKEIVEAILQAQEKEREEIAYELHEGVNQVLSTAKMLLSITNGSQDEMAKTRSIACERISDCIAEVRKISTNINTSTLKLLGLVNAINDVLITASQNPGLQYKFEHEAFDESVHIDFPIQISMFRIFQEIIKNVTNLSGATYVRINLTTQDKTVEFSMEGNGEGFQPESEDYRSAFRNIINRTEQYQGKIKIETSPGNGYYTEILFPVSVI